MTTTNCATCNHWTAKNGEEGLCRRNAPSPTVMTPGSAFTLVWPATRKDDKCGQWEARQEKP